MLELPNVGIAPSTTKHNCDPYCVADWVEGTVLFLGQEFAEADAVDVLMENSVYRKQDFAWEFITRVWYEIRRRNEWLGDGYPIELRDRRAVPKHQWQDVPAHSLCLLLSFAKWYPNWVSSLPRDYLVQGRLLEEITAEALKIEMADWKVHVTGWSRSSSQQLQKKVRDIANLLGEPVGNVERWTKPKAKDAGLDVVCYRPFPDGRAGIPVYLFQCASGTDWDEKLHTPELKIWTRLVEFTVNPSKAFVTPFALSDEEFTIASNRVDGLFIDRHRLLAPARRTVSWLSAPLGAEVVNWLTARVQKLPRYE
jgi:hypothetical protein